MEAVTMKQPPVSNRAMGVVPHNLHSEAANLAINVHCGGYIPKLLVVVLMGGFQSVEVLSTPGLPSHGPGHCPYIHVAVKIKIRQQRPVLSVYLDLVKSPGMFVPHFSLEIHPPDLNRNISKHLQI